MYIHKYPWKNIFVGKKIEKFPVTVKKSTTVYATNKLKAPRKICLKLNKVLHRNKVIVQAFAILEM
jgi:hypothetical protein